MKNIYIRHLARSNRIRKFEIAEKLGCSEFEFSMNLRKEFSPTDRTKVVKIIENIIKEKEVKNESI